jgi:hypothetical protein
MEYRATATDPPRTLAWDEFEAMVRGGEVAPTALVRARVITGDDWWTADNLSLFHRASPVRYPLGHRLSMELEREQRRKEREERMLAALAPYFESYDNGSFVEDCFRVTPLATLVAEPTVVGASRLITMESFVPEYIVTCTFTRQELRVEAVTATTPAMGTMPPLPRELVEELWDKPPKVFDPRDIRSATTVLALEQVPQPFRSSETLFHAARTASSYENPAMDGTSYWHKVRGADVHIEARWENPEPDGDTGQLALVAAYAKLLAATGLKVRRRR